jgi:hypothetical protein
MSTSIDASNGIEFTDVPPRTMPTLEVGDRGDRPAQRVRRVRIAECAVAVPAAALVRHAVAVAADGAAGDPVAGAVHRDEVVDLPGELLLEQVARAAQVARPFLADVADEDDRARRPDVRRLERTRRREHHGEPATVVADAAADEPAVLLLHPDVGPLGEHGVEVAGEHDGGAVASAAALADHVAHRVHADVGKAELLQCRLVGDAARRLHEGGRGNLAERDLLLERPGVVRLQRVEHRAHVGAGGELRGGLGGEGGRERAQREGKTGKDVASTHGVHGENWGIPGPIGRSA